MIYDTHAHYDDSSFDEDRYSVIEGLRAKGIGCVVNISADMLSIRESIALAEKYEFFYSSVGIHPHNAEEYNAENEALLYGFSNNEKVKAIGEIGLDYHYDHPARDIQKKVFAAQLDIAAKTGLPVIIHDREAHEDVLNIIREKAEGLSGVVFHCYSGSVEMAKELFKMGFYISIGGALTFKNSRKLPEVVSFMPLDRIMLETDCPYLAPDPYRGKRNDSGYLYLTARKISEIKGISYEETAAATTENAIKFFGLPPALN
ncbi:MAG: TatD family hydrolase [Eubacteriales bacterium]|nr:TatD family hydrolase [Eubacteriales bacterium]